MKRIENIYIYTVYITTSQGSLRKIQIESKITNREWISDSFERLEDFNKESYEVHAVDGAQKSCDHQLRLVIYPIVYKVRKKISQVVGLGNSEPSTVELKHLRTIPKSKMKRWQTMMIFYLFMESGGMDLAHSHISVLALTMRLLSQLCGKEKGHNLVLLAISENFPHFISALVFRPNEVAGL